MVKSKVASFQIIIKESPFMVIIFLEVLLYCYLLQESSMLFIDKDWLFLFRFLLRTFQGYNRYHFLCLSLFGLSLNVAYDLFLPVSFSEHSLFFFQHPLTYSNYLLIFFWHLLNIFLQRPFAFPAFPCFSSIPLIFQHPLPCRSKLVSPPETRFRVDQVA